MRNHFVETKNVKRFWAAVFSGLLKPCVGIERFLLVFGDPGLGKSEAGIRLLNEYFPSVLCFK